MLLKAFSVPGEVSLVSVVEGLILCLESRKSPMIRDVLISARNEFGQGVLNEEDRGLPYYLRTNTGHEMAGTHMAES